MKAEPVIIHTLELRQSPQWAALTFNARRVLDTLELLIFDHGNGRAGIPCAYERFEQQGIRRKSIAPAIRLCVTLGFVEVVKRGAPSRYRLTYLPATAGRVAA